MPVVTAYRHGVTAGIPPTPSNHHREKRAACAGWTPRSTRGNLAFLRSVRVESLDGMGYAITLTVRDCPATSDDWKRLREAFFFRLRQAGLIRLHWVTEWQRRGVPHLHAAVWVSDHLNVADLLQHWLDVAGQYGATLAGQHFAPISDALGWFQYVAKHAARGAAHYQRSPENVPEQWQQRTGRVWGKVGAWDLTEPVRLSLDLVGYHRLRRMVRSWRKADARASGSARRIVQARRMLACPERKRSAVRGLSEWLPVQQLERVMGLLIAEGADVEVRRDDD